MPCPCFWPSWIALMQLVVLLSAPVIIIMLLAELGLGLASRFTPQLQVFFLAMPIKTGLALFVLVLYAGILFGHIDQEARALDRPAAPPGTSLAGSVSAEKTEKPTPKKLQDARKKGMSPIAATSARPC